MGHIDGDAGRRQGVQQRFGGGQETALGAGAVGIGTGAVMGYADQAQPQTEPFGHLVGPEDGIGAFHSQDQADGSIGGRILPSGYRRV